MPTPLREEVEEVVKDRISVVVGTFGDEAVWEPLAQRATKSAHWQTTLPHEVLHVHGDTLAGARNEGAEIVSGDWLLFLDADDELDAEYIEAMTSAIWRVMARSDARDFLLQPATLGIVGDRVDPEPVVIPQCRLAEGNYMVIGTLVARDQFLRVGGFRELPVAEDWDLWCRCRIDGAVTVPVPAAIYRVHVNEQSRNAMSNTYIQTYNDIRSTYADALKNEVLT